MTSCLVNLKPRILSSVDQKHYSNNKSNDNKRFHNFLSNQAYGAAILGGFQNLQSLTQGNRGT